MAEAQLKPFRQASFAGGMVSGLNEAIKPPGSVALCVNFDPDYEIGSLTTRLGTFIVGGQMVAGKSVLGLHNYISGATSKLFSAINDTDDATSVIYDEAGNVVVTGLTASKKTRFLTYLGSMLMINGADAEQAWNGTAWITTGGAFDLANIPGSNLNNLCTVFLDRVYLAGDTANPTRLYYSGISNGSAVSWTSGNGYVDIENGNNKGAITAFGRVPGYILIFKARSMSRWNFNSAFPEEMITYGTPSQESVVSSNGVCAFFSNSNEHDKGFFMTNGDQPIPISHNNSRPIKKWVDAIPAANESSIAGRAVHSGFAWSVGDLTVDGQAYHNVELVYNRILNQWSARTYPTRFTVYATYLDGQGRNVVVAGDNDGCVLELDRPERYVDYQTVSGAPGEVSIGFDVRTHEEIHGLNQRKMVSDKLVFNTREGQGATPYVVVDGGETIVCGALARDVSEARLPKNPTGNYFAYGLRGTVQGKRLVLKEIEVPSITAVPAYEG